MRILFAGDQHPYSAYALKRVIELAINTWADVTFLAVYPTFSTRDQDSPVPLDDPLTEALYRYRGDFLGSSGNEDSPYAMENWKYEWIPLKDGAWEEMKVCRGRKKDLKVRVRAGNTAAEILSEANEEGSDLIVLGCTKGNQCLWQEPPGVPQRVVNDARCSVLLVKEEQPIRRILACIDQMSISQESLEMVNQMVTIHNAQLELVGLTKSGAASVEAYSRLIEVGDYYTDRHIEVKTRLEEVSDFEGFIARESGHDLLAFSMGKKSLINLFFPREWVGRFVSTCQSSVLVLR